MHYSNRESSAYETRLAVEFTRNYESGLIDSLKYDILYIIN